MVTSDAAALLRRTAGSIAIGLPADLIVVPPVAPKAEAALLETDRASLRLVMIAGRPIVGDIATEPVFSARCVKSRPLVVDRVPKVADSGLVRRIAGCPIAEPGVTVR